ncbi:hypothetical protein [Cetobacterium ceti]
MNNKLFSIYDFLGYLVPAIFFTTVLTLISKIQNRNYSFKEINKIFKFTNTIKLESILSLIVIMYVLGHLLSYVSSITIEKYSIRTLGYPSKYLLGLKKEQGYFKIKENKVFRFLAYLLNFLFLFPITFWDLILSHSFLKMSKIIAKPLEKEIQCILKKCICKNLTIKYEIFDFCHNSKIDFLRIIYHEIVENSERHFPKIQNYVALYGFSRTISLTLNILTFFLFYPFISHDISLSLFLLLIALFSFSSFLMYCSYNKFLRKYNLEILMAYLIKNQSKTDKNCCSKKCY